MPFCFSKEKKIYRKGKRQQVKNRKQITAILSKVQRLLFALSTSSVRLVNVQLSGSRKPSKHMLQLHGWHQHSGFIFTACAQLACELHAVDQMLFPSPAGFSSCTKCSACLLSFHVNIFFFLVFFCLITRCNKSSTMQYSPRWLLASCSDSGGGFKLDLTDHNGCGQPVQCEVKAIIQADIFKCNQT